MSVRYFQTPAGVVQYGNLTEDALRVLLDAGHTEITAEEYQAETGRQAEARAALFEPPARPESAEEPEEERAGGGS
ncbi:MAG TPA: hypothetical protein VK545_26545 [Streptomyces sp.]|nr:hypothetical protein [Streptomyces sp.]